MRQTGGKKHAVAFQKIMQFVIYKYIIFLKSKVKLIRLVN